VFAELSELKTPTGILALIDLPQPAGTIADSRFALLLEDVQDPGNLGSMLRSARAAGAMRYFFPRAVPMHGRPRCCAPRWAGICAGYPRAAGFAGCSQNICELPLRSLPAYLRRDFAGDSLQATHSLYDCDLRGKVAFLIGNEGAGLSDDLLNLATQQITIPMPARSSR